ncbi:hypothetical protein [Paenibacillus humicola]|uniref:hypothetical protein n=1 Tax=Paenibacillus humicola TaxID=3110540 RepID=UPI00237B0DE4|nr:hypothetical protein [Paenibacillus humicola]
MVKKKLLTFLVAVLIVFSFTITPAFAYTTGSCSGSTGFCTYLTMYSGDLIGKGNAQPLNQNYSTYYEFQTTSDSLFNVSFWLERYDDTSHTWSQVTSPKNAAQKGGTNYGFYTTSSAGTYRLVAKCGDTVSGRCAGTGTFETW